MTINRKTQNSVVKQGIYTINIFYYKLYKRLDVDISIEYLFSVCLFTFSEFT